MEHSGTLSVSQKFLDRPTGHPSLKQSGNLHTETKEKANILHQQFQSVFTPLAPLSLQELSLMKVQYLVDGKVITPGALSEDLRNSTLLMPDIIISEARILNLLKNLIPKKAAGQTYHPSRTKGGTGSNYQSSF